MDGLAYEAMRLIHAKNLRFTFTGNETTYTARFTPREVPEDQEKKTVVEKVEGVLGQGELKNPLERRKGKEKQEIVATVE